MGSGSLLDSNPLDMGEVDSVLLTVITDNNRNEDIPDFQIEWGVSMLLETENLTLLLDTGMTYEVLKYNSNFLKKDLSTVDAVIISHEHGDHIGGLSYIAEINPEIDVYVPANMTPEVLSGIVALDFNVISINETTMIYPDFAIIGQLNGPPFEQALATNIKDLGLLVTVGCSHPGVENIVDKAVMDLNLTPYMVIGGFHLGGQTIAVYNETLEALLDHNISKIFSIHCSGDGIRTYARLNYPEFYGDGNVGYTTELDSTELHLPPHPSKWYLYLIPVGVIVLIIPITIIIRKKKAEKS